MPTDTLELSRYMESILRRASAEYPERRFTTREIVRKFLHLASPSDIKAALARLVESGAADSLVGTYRVEAVTP